MLPLFGSKFPNYSMVVTSIKYFHAQGNHRLSADSLTNNVLMPVKPKKDVVAPISPIKERSN